MENPKKGGPAPRKKKHGGGGGGGGHDSAGGMRWLLTYADMLTLLFALFVIMYAVSKPQVQKVIEVQSSMAEALHGQPKTLKEMYQSIQKKENKAEKQEQTEEFINYLKQHKNEKAVKELLQQVPTLQKQLSPGTSSYSSPLRPLEDLKGKVDRYVGENHLEGALKTTIQPERGLVIQILTDGVLFDLGQADLKPKTKSIIATITQFLKEEKISNQIRVDGHTDDIPIRAGARYVDNMELSMARAGNVWRYMIQLGMPPTQVSAAGYGPYRPLVPNTSSSNRQRNRRVEITIPPMEKEKILPRIESKSPTN